MELGTILIIVIALGYATKNAKGKQVVEHCGNTMVHLAASADKASAALEKQCDELLMSDAEVEAAKAKAKAKLSAKTVADDYSDAI